MPRLAALTLLVVIAAGARAISLEPPDTEALKARPVATGNFEWARLLQGWYAKGEAAGNVGDAYDNRDRMHSAIARKRFPQLQWVVYDEREKAHRLDFGLMRAVHEFTVVGNSSTASGVIRGGSNPRWAYAQPRLVNVLAAQYLGSNLYVYPEHRDYDPGLHGAGGYGDVFPLNTPYLLVSRGSSGSDRPFIRAAVAALAALRPDVKARLRANRLLMPTVQMLVRRTLKGVETHADYLHGKAHPPAFDGSRVDLERLVRMANGITVDRLPPFAVIKVLDESESLPGRDFFHPAQPERWVSTGAAVGRVFRGPRREYRMVVSAEASADLNRRGLAWHWVVLRGDRDRIDIKPLNERGSRAELRVRFHDVPIRAPDDPAIAGHRADIGIFVHNGSYFSPPALVSFLFPADQRREYGEDGRVVEIGYGATTVRIPAGGPGRPEIRYDYVSDWPRLYRAVTGNPRGMKLLDALLAEPAVSTRLREAASRFAGADGPLAAALERRRETAAALKAARAGKSQDAIDAAGATHREANERVKAASADLDAFMGETPSPEDTDRAFVERALEGLRRQVDLYARHREAITALLLVGKGPSVGAARKYRDTLFHLGLLPGKGAGLEAPAPVAATGPIARDHLRQLNLHLLGACLGGAIKVPAANYVDPRVVLPADWRDVYRYEGDRLAGWTRFHPDGPPQSFDRHGKLVTSRDPEGRPTGTVMLEYTREGDTSRPATWKLGWKRAPPRRSTPLRSPPPT